LRLLPALLLVSGCARSYSFKPYSAQSPVDLISELSERRRLCNNFDSSLRYEIQVGERSVKLNGTASLREGRYWRITMEGPFGVKLLLIETGQGGYRIENSHTGLTEEGFLDDPILLPDVGVEFPSLDFLGDLVLPTPDIPYPQDWSITYADSSRLSLTGLAGLTGDSLLLEVDYAPLRVKAEERWREGRRLYRRDYFYEKPQSLYPESVKAELGEVLIGVQYRRITLKRERTPLELRAPF